MARKADVLTIQPWARDGDRQTPAQNALAWLMGWPESYSIQGSGFLPEREVFNHLFYLALLGIIEVGERGLLEWDDEQNYEHPSFVVGSDTNIYKSIIASGPDNGGAVNPVTENPRTTWAVYRTAGQFDLASNSEHTQTNPPSNKAATPLGVRAVRDALLDSPPGALDTLNELAAALGDDPNFSATISSMIALRALINSPDFTGNPQSVTPSDDNDSRSIATTEWSRDRIDELPSSVRIDSIPDGGIDSTDLVAGTAFALTENISDFSTLELSVRRQATSPNVYRVYSSRVVASLIPVARNDNIRFGYIAEDMNLWRPTDRELRVKSSGGTSTIRVYQIWGRP